MKKQNLAIIKQYLLPLIIVISGILGVLVATGNGESIRKTLGIVLVILIALFAGLSAAEDLTQESLDTPQSIVQNNNLYHVNEVIDGDTIEIDGNIRVRLIGIDAPESGKCYYEEAKNELIRLVDGEDVRLEKDVEEVDIYSRLLRYVILPSNDVVVNEHLLRYGYAQTISSVNKQYFRDFVSARDEALTQRRGLWSDACDYASEYEQKHASTREIHELPSDPKCVIKGNVSRTGIGKIYFLPSCRNYTRVKIDARAGEQYFCTEKEAQAAGFRKSGDCP